MLAEKTQEKKMKKSFKIEFGPFEIDDKINLFLIIPKLSIFFDNDLLQSPWVRDKKIRLDYTDSEYSVGFFMRLLSEAKLFDKKEHIVNFSDDPLQLRFKKIGDDVELKFGSGKDITGNTKIPHSDFINEVLRVTGKFVENVLEIEPKLVEHEDINELIKKRELLNTVYKKCYVKKNKKK